MARDLALEQHWRDRIEYLPYRVLSDAMVKVERHSHLRVRKTLLFFI